MVREWGTSQNGNFNNSWKFIESIDMPFGCQLTRHPSLWSGFMKAIWMYIVLKAIWMLTLCKEIFEKNFCLFKNLTGSPSMTFPLTSRTTIICWAVKLTIRTGPWSIILPAAIWKICSKKIRLTIYQNTVFKLETVNNVLKIRNEWDLLKFLMTVSSELVEEETVNTVKKPWRNVSVLKGRTQFDKPSST